MTKKLKTVLVIIVLITIAIMIAGIIKFNVVGDYVYISETNNPTIVDGGFDEYTFTTKTGEKGDIAFEVKDRAQAILVLDGESYPLKIAVSGSGSRYTNEDESVEYWEHQGEASIKIKDKTYTAINIVQKAEEVELNTKENENTQTKTDNNQTSISGNNWMWEKTIYSDDKMVNPTDSKQFIANFSTEGQFSSSTDCNNVFGDYTLGSDNTIAFGSLASTKKACAEETKEMEYAKMLNEVTSYMIDKNGDLVLMLKYDSGSMIFKKSE